MEEHQSGKDIVGWSFAGTFQGLAQSIYWNIDLFDAFRTLFAYFDIWCIHLSSPEQESYSEGETDRSARTGDSEILKSSEIKGLRFSIFRREVGLAGGAPGHSPVSNSQNVPKCYV